MPRKPGVGARAEAVREALIKFQGASKNAVARYLYKNNPLLFTSVDNARATVRWFTKSKGRVSKEMGLESKVDFKSNFTSENPFGLPDSYAVERKPFILPTSCNNILILSDLHIPYQINEAIECALKYGKDNKVNTVFINGDLIDFHNMSRFEKDPRKRNIYQEFEAVIQFLKTLRKTFPKASIYYHLGNHDIRYQMWLQRHPEIFGDPYYELENRLGLNNFKVTLIDDKTITKAGKLSIHHGHYMFRSQQSPVSPARTLLLKAKQSMVCGHTHKISEATATNLDQNIYSTWSTGCLCELLPDYNPMANDNAHGFAHAKINKDGTFTFKNVRIFEGKIL